MGRHSSRVWVGACRSRGRGLSGTLRDTSAPPRTFTSWLKPVAALVVPPPRVPAGDETRPARGPFDPAVIGGSSTPWRGTRDPNVAILSAAQPPFAGRGIVGAAGVEEDT